MKKIISIAFLALIATSACSKNKGKDNSSAPLSENKDGQPSQHEEAAQSHFTFEKAMAHLDGTTLNDSEKDALAYLVKLFSDKNLFNKATRLCADQSSKLNEADCIRFVQAELVDMRLVTRTKP